MTDLAPSLTPSILRPAPRPTSGRAGFDIGPVARGLIVSGALGMGVACTLALVRLAAGLAPDHPHLHEAAVMLHVVTVLPAVPLGAYVLLTRKGTARHRLLGKIWLVLMVVTALSALFIQTTGGFSWIHIFVPLTLHAAWKTIATARAGNIAAHKRLLVGTYLGALLIPGAFTFLPGRLMGALLFG